MKSFLHKTATVTEHFNERFGQMLAITPLALIMVQFLIIVLAAVFDSGSIKMQESLQYMNALMFLGGVGYTLKHDGHVRVDLIYCKLSPRGKAIVNLLGTVFLLLPFVVLIWVVGLPYVIDGWVNKDGSVETSGLPYVYVLKSTILLFALTLSVQLIANSIRDTQQLTQKETD